MIDCILERKNKRKMLNSFCNQDKLLKVKKIYEYGDGIYSAPLEIRVKQRVSEFEKTHKVVKVEYHWIEQKYLGKNCLNMDVWRPRECHIYITYQNLE